MTGNYQPSPLPDAEAPELSSALEREHRNVERAFDSALNLPPARSADVQKARDGWLRYFDAAVYDPGQGTGLYLFSGGVWRRVSVT